MARPCTICRHPDRGEIDRALVRGEPFRDIGSRTATTKDSLARHKRDHIPQLIEARDEAERQASTTVLATVRADAVIDSLSSVALAADLVEMRDFVREAAQEARSKSRYRDTAELAKQWHAADVALLAAAFKREEIAPPDAPVAHVVEALRAAMAYLPPEHQRLLARRIDEIEAAS